MSDLGENEDTLTMEHRLLDVIGRQQDTIQALTYALADREKNRDITIVPSMPPLTREMVSEILRAEGVLLYRPIVEDEDEPTEQTAP